MPKSQSRNGKKSGPTHKWGIPTRAAVLDCAAWGCRGWTWGGSCLSLVDLNTTPQLSALRNHDVTDRGKQNELKQPKPKQT